MNSRLARKFPLFLTPKATGVPSCLKPLSQESILLVGDLCIPLESGLMNNSLVDKGGSLEEIIFKNVSRTRNTLSSSSCSSIFRVILTKVSNNICGIDTCLRRFFLFICLILLIFIRCERFKPRKLILSGKFTHGLTRVF